MLEELKSRRFELRNLDCANCAAKIEKGLNEREDFENAVVDFATLSLHIKSSNVAQVIAAVADIEPDVEVVARSEQVSAHEPTESIHGKFPKREVMGLVAAILLLLSQIVLESWFHHNALSSLEFIVILIAYLLAGYNVLLGAWQTIRRGEFFDENVLMVIATVGALAIHAYSEAVGVMVFYKIGELLQNRAVDGSRRSIAALLAARPDKAVVQTNEGFRETVPEFVKIGETILIKPGGKIPLDGQVLSGKSYVDASALTGESVPLSKAPGEDVMAGQVNQTAALTVRVTRRFAESSIAKVMELVENATARKARTEKFITKFARYYTPAVVLIAAMIACLPPLLIADASFKTWIYRALVLLVISCPCALVISIPLGYFAGIGLASRRGILVKGSNFIDALAKVKTVVFDKTGTLTQGVFNVSEIATHNGYSENQILEFAAAAEAQSNHPIALSILVAFSQTGLHLKSQHISEHENLAGRGVKARYLNQEILVGNDHLLHAESVDHDRCDFDGTVVHVAVDNQYAGYIVIGDQIRSDAKSTVGALRKNGIEKVAMLTGDNACTAEYVSKQLEMDEFHADLLPEDKVRIFEKIQGQNQDGDGTAFVGDGINDAPVIARADVGVAMGALGSDAAIETADVVLMQDSPHKVAEAISIAHKTRRIVWQNIALAFTIKGFFILMGSLGMASMWEAVFADMGTAVLAVANSTRILRISS
jgi:Cd2+/Zn2+-exporting ATPase